MTLQTGIVVGGDSKAKVAVQFELAASSSLMYCASTNFIFTKLNTESLSILLKVFS